MTTLCLLIGLFFALVASVRAQAEFRYYVFDNTKTEKLNYEIGYDLTVYHFPPAKPRLSYQTEYRIAGVAQESFTYTVESWSVDISEEKYAKLLGAVKDISPRALDPKKIKETDRGSHGWMEWNGRNPKLGIIAAHPDEWNKGNHWVSVSLNNPERARLHAALMGFLDQNVARRHRKSTTRTIEGDLAPAHPIAFAELLRFPAKFDGKRVRLTGFYHLEFEGCNFGPDKKSGYKESVWPRYPSSFADGKKFPRVNDVFVVAEGTFNAGPGGHLGLWAGELARLTRLEKINKP